MYLLDSEYTGQDEFGVRWNDRALGLPENWYAGTNPVVSARDAALPMLADVIAASPFGNRPT
jgi:dTDP-4-dehydrorhamnose 3,5-epimerase-like enzyme